MLGLEHRGWDGLPSMLFAPPAQEDRSIWLWWQLLL